MVINLPSIVRLSNGNIIGARFSPVDRPHEQRLPSVAMPQDILQGTLDLMVLQTLEAMGPLHGYGIARRIEQVSEDVLQLNQGTIYASLLRLQQRRWITASWGVSENNRRAKYYTITKSGRKQLASEADSWVRMAGVIGRLLKLSPER
jgi:PadR family transcriptional regulator, regulatory protein PadR